MSGWDAIASMKIRQDHEYERIIAQEYEYICDRLESDA
jgi:hypothetical protein